MYFKTEVFMGENLMIKYMLLKPIWRLDSKRQNQHFDEKFELATLKNQGF